MARNKSVGSSMRDRARKRAKERESSGGGTLFKLPENVKFFQPKKGKQTIDILPFRVTHEGRDTPVGDLDFERSFKVHYNIGIEDNSYVCPKSIGKKCPICEHLANLKNDPNADEDIVKALKPKERQIFNVINVGAHPNGDVELFAASYYNFGRLLDEEINALDEDEPFFANLEDGQSLRIRWSEEKLGANKYLAASRIDFVNRKPYTDDILDEVLDLDAILNILPYDKLRDIFYEIEDEDKQNSSADSDETKTQKRERSSNRRNRRAESQESESDNDDDDPEEDEKPKRGRGRGRGHTEKPPEPDDEQEENEDPEDDNNDGDQECPEDGGIFGVDTDEYDACDECPIWEECRKAKMAATEKSDKGRGRGRGRR